MTATALQTLGWVLLGAGILGLPVSQLVLIRWHKRRRNDP